MHECECIALMTFSTSFVNIMQVSNSKFCNLGLNPITLEQGLLDEVVDIAEKYHYRCDPSKVLPSSFWNKDRAAAAAAASGMESGAK